MRMNLTKSVLLVAPAMALGGCALLQPQDDPTAARIDELERRLATMERVVQNQSLVNMTQQGLRRGAPERRDPGPGRDAGAWL